MLDSWVLLQDEFNKQMKLFLMNTPRSILRSGNTLFKIMDVLDPSLTKYKTGEKNLHAVAMTTNVVFQERIKTHLRYHCSLYLMLLFMNDMESKKNPNHEVEGVPTLYGFASFIDHNFGIVVAASLKTGDSCESIRLFYEGEHTPVWDMLKNENQTKNLEDYLTTTNDKRLQRAEKITVGKLMCASPNSVFSRQWPTLSHVNSEKDKDFCLKEYVFKCNGDDDDKPLPPIREGVLRSRTFIVEMTLPVRVLLTNKNGDGKWNHQFDYYTKNITTGMLQHATCTANIPNDWVISNYAGTQIGQGGSNNNVSADTPLTSQQFKLWAEVLLDVPPLQDLHKLQIFRYILMVEDSMIELLPKCLKEEHEIWRKKKLWESSPLRLDWGENTKSHFALGDDFHCIVLDEHIAQHFADPSRNSPLIKTRDQWSSATFFNISTDKFFFAQHEKNMYDMIWGEKSVTTASDIGPLVNCTCTDFPHHQFGGVAAAVACQVRKMVEETHSRAAKQSAPVGLARKLRVSTFSDFTR